MIIRLFTQPELRATLSKNARILIEQEYNWEQSGAKYEQILSKG
jgi:glycosyltransferase involved in cell wall biosynthesis